MNALTLSLVLVIAGTVETFAAGKIIPAAVSQSAGGGVPDFDIRSICTRLPDGFETSTGCAADEQTPVAAWQGLDELCFGGEVTLHGAVQR